ncbi:MAG: TetR/AcrR family transcriptional regulator [Lachnospiraceae bacterium]|nr:TetR/AcrR family transcriptional regulator [Lachnospiraceae bacterium]
MGKLEDKKRLKRKAILKSAFKLFTEKGVTETSVSDITRDAKLAKGTFYLYYKDKYEVRDELISIHGSRLIREAREEVGNIEEIENCSFDEIVIQIIDNIINRFIRNKSLLKFINKNLSWALLSDVTIDDEENMSSLDIFKNLIKLSGEHFRNEDVMIFMLVETTSAMCHASILDNDTIGIEELKPELYTNIRSIVKQFKAE